ncbi:hypothetical protein QQF64_008218 [Cirrhinus molitorella]|uniref:Uncharacterized protein n=1 Tax=Cirrhinus molitorella TaxID=172907 RepID=A0ABR3M5I6_9TELE
MKCRSAAQRSERRVRTRRRSQLHLSGNESLADKKTPSVQHQIIGVKLSSVSRRDAGAFTAFPKHRLHSRAALVMHIFNKRSSRLFMKLMIKATGNTLLSRTFSLMYHRHACGFSVAEFRRLGLIKLCQNF